MAAHPPSALAPAASAAGDAKTIADLLTTLFGSSSKQSTSVDFSQLTEGTTLQKEYTDLDPLAIERLIQQVLGSQQGLASVFAGEQSSGLYNSSVANQAAGNLVAQLVGELAKLTSPKITDITKKESVNSTTNTDVNSSNAGLLDTMGTGAKKNVDSFGNEVKSLFAFSDEGGKVEDFLKFKWDF